MPKAEAYLIDVDDKEGFRTNYRLDANHQCNLMGVTCPECGAWGYTGIEYPSINCSELSGLIRAEHFLDSRKSRTMTLDELAETTERAQPVLGGGRPFLPAADFGPMTGKGSGKFDDFVWLYLWTMLVRQSIFDDLCDAGFQLIGVPADIKFRREPHEILVELEAHIKVRLHPSVRPQACKICGRHITELHSMLLDLTTFDSSVPLQRIAEWPTKFVANSDFAEFILNRRFSGARLTPLELK